MRVLIASALLLAAGALSQPQQLFALSAGGLGGYPAHQDPGIQYSDSWFIYNLDLGESKEDALVLTNTSDGVQVVKLYTVDSVATADGNFSLQSENEPRTGIGAWIRLNTAEVTLHPHEEYTVPFVIAIPLTAEVGEYSGGIIIQQSAVPAAGGGSAGASIVTRVGIRVYETVPGDIIKNVELLDFAVKRETPGNAKPLYRAGLTVQNQSNVSVNARVMLKVSGWGKLQYFPKSRFTGGLFLDFSDFTNFFKGQELMNELQLLRDQKVSTSWEWPEPAFGHFVFQGVVSYEGVGGRQEIRSGTRDVWVIPWTELFVLILVILLCVLFIWFRRKRRGRRSVVSNTVEKEASLRTGVPVRVRRAQPARKRRTVKSPKEKV